MHIRTDRPFVLTGLATVATALAITSSGIEPAQISPPRLLAESVSVQLQALAVSSEVSIAAPSTAPTAASVATPDVVLTDVIKAALSVAATVAWFVAFPVTLPTTVVVGGLLSLYSNLIRLLPPVIDPFVGIGLFFTLPGNLLRASFTTLGYSLGLIEPSPPSAINAAKPTLAKSSSVGARKRSARIAAANQVRVLPARSAKKASATRGLKTETRSVAHGRRP